MNAIESIKPVSGCDAVTVEGGGSNAPPLDPASVTPAAPEHTPLITGKFLPKEWLTEAPPEHEFCVNPLVPVGAVTLLNGHGGVGKSLFALKMAVHIALGLPILGAETNGGNVAYMSIEDPENIVWSRMSKIFIELPEDARQRIDELTAKMMIIDRYGVQTHMAIHETGDIKTAPVACDLSALLKRHDIKCVFVDTLIRTHTLKENDNGQMGALLAAFEHIAKEAGCGVVLLHHLPKDGDNEAYAARGASAITDNARSALLLKTLKKDEADKLAGENIKAAVMDGRLIEVSHRKHNYSAPHPKRYLEMTADGVLLEVFASTDPRSALEQRYSELYRWWATKFNRRPLTKTTIDEQYAEIRPAGTKYGKETYKKALQVAIDAGCAEEVAPPAGASTNPNAKYYALFDTEQPTLSKPPVENPALAEDSGD